MAETVIGTVETKDSLFLRKHAGTAKLGDNAYELSTSMASLPLIKSEKTGKYWLISWQQLLDLAIQAGIDNSDEEIRK